MWLSTTDIENVMEQYHAAHPTFKFIGVHPRDFTAMARSGGSCISGTDVCDPPLADLHKKKNIKHIGAVFNMDKHDQRGSHWVSCFISMDATKPMYGAYYYDSVARPPPPEIAAWMLKIQKIVDGFQKSDRPFELAYNRERRQFQNTECGMFSMVFLTVAMRNADTFTAICNAMGNDRDMNTLRQVMYR
ncbi:hypothetical protein TSOC_002729 [Tetrabaena socialis]|uniref:Ubiquitin-like protease family profile domain-containing protein n=1 Tax=Tetrabaena socialis TaxID=47790 RepID=A0A2J8ADE2_9CHLO|nr:hypothetical protein TSOC_002729 [Tetrabaena socialis]|eukprot:PNH10541.1 hypothetical protein TSOC_002729 [Tetrabaena socialis]